MFLRWFYLEKNQKNTHCYSFKLASEENVHILLIFSLETSCLWYSTKCQLRVPEVICAQSHTTTCLSRHNSRWLLDLSPPNNPLNARALSVGPRLSLFSEVSYWIFTSIECELHVSTPCEFWLQYNIVSSDFVSSLVGWLLYIQMYCLRQI